MKYSVNVALGHGDTAKCVGYFVEADSPHQAAERLGLSINETDDRSRNYPDNGPLFSLPGDLSISMSAVRVSFQKLDETTNLDQLKTRIIEKYRGEWA